MMEIVLNSCLHFFSVIQSPVEHGFCHRYKGAAIFREGIAYRYGAGFATAADDEVLQISGPLPRLHFHNRNISSANPSSWPEIHKR